MINNAALYGEGKGAAQVIDNSGIDNAYAQIIARQQAQRQNEVKLLTDQQAQLKPEGLRNDADRQHFFNGVNEWRNLSIQAQNERDPYKRSMLKSQADQKYLGLHDFAGKSKQAAQAEQQFSTQLLNPVVRDRYSPDVVNKFLGNKNLSVNDPNYVKDFNTYEQVADHTKTLKEIDELNKKLLTNAKWNTPTLVNQKVGNRNATFINNSRSVDPELQANAYTRKFDVDQNFRKTLQDLHPEIFNNPDLTPAQQKEQAIGTLIKNYGPIAEYKAPIEKVDKEPNMTLANHIAMRQYDIAHPLPGQNPNQLTPAQITVNNMKTGSPDAINHFLGLTPKGQYGGAKPVFSEDPLTGEHVFKFPDQVQKDNKAIEANRKLRAEYEKNPETTGILWNKKVVPFEKSSVAVDLKPETIVKQPGQVYKLNPNDPEAYFGQASQMAKDQNIALPALNQIMGAKGGHGIIAQAKTPTKAGKKSASTYGL